MGISISASSESLSLILLHRRLLNGRHTTSLSELRLASPEGGTLSFAQEGSAQWHFLLF